MGDKLVSDLKQRDINDFFKLIQRLPPRWKDESRKMGLTVRALAEKEYDRTLSKKTFEDTYKASVRAFLLAARKDWQDEGFPITLTTEGIEYEGVREGGENKQRALTIEELK